MPRIIGTLREQSLHADLKDWFAEPGDLLEQEVEGYVIDIVRGETLIEIQTGNFTAIRSKLKKLLKAHQVRLIYPVSSARWVVRLAKDGKSERSRRKSPKRGHVEDLFLELVRMPGLALDPNLTIEVVLVHEEQVLIDDGQGSWRRKGWSVHDRRLLEIESRHQFDSAHDYLALIPSDLEQPFTNRELSNALDRRVALVQKMTYSLRAMGLLEQVGKQGNAYLFAVPDGVAS